MYGIAIIKIHRRSNLLRTKKQPFWFIWPFEFIEILNFDLHSPWFFPVTKQLSSLLRVRFVFIILSWHRWSCCHPAPFPNPSGSSSSPWLHTYLHPLVKNTYKILVSSIDSFYLDSARYGSMTWTMNHPRLNNDYYNDDDDRTQYNINVRYTSQLPQPSRTSRGIGSRSSSTSSISSSYSPSMNSAPFQKSHSRNSSNSSNISNASFNFGQIPFPSIQSTFPDHVRSDISTYSTSSILPGVPQPHPVAEFPFFPSHAANRSSTSSIPSIKSGVSGVATPNSTRSPSPTSTHSIHAFPSSDHYRDHVPLQHQNQHTHGSTYDQILPENHTHTLTASHSSSQNNNNDTVTKINVSSQDDDTARLSSHAAPAVASTTGPTQKSSDAIPPSVHRQKKKVKQSSNYYTNISNMVCLFWFNDYSTLEAAFERGKTIDFAAGNPETNCLSSIPFSKLSIPTAAFKQFTMNVIKHTQLAPTAVSLALYYILRLKQFSTTPIVGNANSEYRVFSVALILANKFLSDNTYTNKTWATVTHLPLNEISTMEVEFLANMRYTLYVNADEWTAWQGRLRVWLNIHSSISLNSSILPTTAFPPSFTQSANIASYSLNAPSGTLNHPKRFMGEHIDRPPLKKVAVLDTDIASHGRIIAADRLSSSPYAPVFPVRALLANAQPPYDSRRSSSSSSASNSSISSPLSRHTSSNSQLSFQQQLPPPVLPPSSYPVYYYTLADQKNKIRPSPHFGYLPSNSQAQSPACSMFEMDYYRPNNALFDPLSTSQVPPMQLGQYFPPPPSLPLAPTSVPSTSMVPMHQLQPLPPPLKHSQSTGQLPGPEHISQHIPPLQQPSQHHKPPHLPQPLPYPSSLHSTWKFPPI